VPPPTADRYSKLLAEGEIVEHEGLTRTRQRLYAPEQHFEHEQHRRTMRVQFSDGK
jgi:hypothetical protein